MKSGRKKLPDSKKKTRVAVVFASPEEMEKLGKHPEQELQKRIDAIFGR